MVECWWHTYLTNRAAVLECMWYTDRLHFNLSLHWTIDSSWSGFVIVITIRRWQRSEYVTLVMTILSIYDKSHFWNAVPYTKTCTYTNTRPCTHIYACIHIPWTHMRTSTHSYSHSHIQVHLYLITDCLLNVIIQKCTFGVCLIRYYFLYQYILYIQF